MEWQIMNNDGLNGTCHSLGEWIDGKYEISDDCEENLIELLEKVQSEDPVERNVRRQLAAANIIQKDLVTILTEVEDDPAIFKSAIRLLVSLTQPLECLQQVSSQSPLHLPWLMDVEKMLIEAKITCTNIKFLNAIFKEIQTIIEDGQMEDYDLTEDDCDTINECLLLIRNLLHTQDSIRAGTPSSSHMMLLKGLFQCGIDKVLLQLLNTRQKDYWGVIVVQLISLLYKDLVGEIFLLFEDVSSCGEESCDSSNCSQCEAAMDRQTCGSMGAQDRVQQNSPLTLNEGTVIFSLTAETETIIPTQSETCGDESGQENVLNKTDVVAQKTEMVQSFSASFRQSCYIRNESAEESCETCQIVSGSEEGASPVSAGSPSVSPCQSQESFNSASDGTADLLHVSMEQLGLKITDFTTQFIQRGFSSLVHILQNILMTKSTSSPALDESYFLWSIAFFLKFARRKEIEFKNIRDVFTTDVFGFLVFEAINNGESILIAHKNKETCNLTMRRLHLSVCALRELFKTLSFHRDRGLSDDDMQYLDDLQRNLANMSDLRQLFLWLIRQFKSGYHSNLFLRDVIVTNHYFLLLFEEWIGKSYASRRNIDMLDHVKQFATETVMQQYGHLLQNFARNDHHVNNCLFTMMHHVAGDCQQPDSLLQVNILKTFIEIWDREFPITREMNDLMEYVIHRFLSTAEDNPLSCAIQLFMGMGEESNGETGTSGEECDWSEEEEDKLIMWYNQLEGERNIIEKLSDKFGKDDMKKSKLEIVNHLSKLGWLSSKELEGFVATHSETDCNTPLQGLVAASKEKAEADLSILGVLSGLPEDEVIPYCVKQLVSLKEERQLQFIQRNLLEVAYVKLDEDYIEKKYIEEPLVKYYIGKRTAVPLLFYNDEEDRYNENVYFIAILEQLGCLMEEDTGLLYPRIPNEWSVVELVDKARMLGEIKTESVKFDISNVSKEVDITYSTMKSDLTSLPAAMFSKQPKKGAKGNIVAGTTWMNFIGKYNANIEVNSLKVCEMDTSQ